MSSASIIEQMNGDQRSSVERHEITLTVTQLQHRLEVTTMTIYLWRQGEQGTPPLPNIQKTFGKGKVRIVFFYSEVLEWLEKYKPKLVDRFKGNRCACRHCIKATSLRAGA